MKLCGFNAGNKHPIFLIAGTCVVESEAMAVDTAGTLKEICGKLDVPLIYKSSFDKANRSSAGSFRGPGMEEGLRILAEVKRQIGVPILTDVHEDTPMDEAADVVDVLQTPAFLCRQTNFILRAASAGKPVNIKKGQFLSPWEMQNVVDKARSTGNSDIMVCERGFSFGYNNLVSDMRSLARAQPPAASVNSYRCWRVRLRQAVSPDCLWRRTPILSRLLATGQTHGRSAGCRLSSRRLSRSMRS
jgi:2-dehydro-3-deoxyphosphooctonate aldolase (KDO 8-P synthase)